MVWRECESHTVITVISSAQLSQTLLSQSHYLLSSWLCVMTSWHNPIITHHMSHSCHASHSHVTALASSPCLHPSPSSTIIALQRFAFLKQLFATRWICNHFATFSLVSNSSSSGSGAVSGIKWSVGNVTTHTHCNSIGSEDSEWPLIGLFWPCVHSERSSQFFLQNFSLLGTGAAKLTSNSPMLCFVKCKIVHKIPCLFSWNHTTDRHEIWFVFRRLAPSGSWFSHCPLGDKSKQSK